MKFKSVLVVLVAGLICLPFISHGQWVVTPDGSASFTATEDNMVAVMRQAAEKGDAVEQYRLGRWAQGRGNYEEAAKWYRLSAEQGYSVAQCTLGSYCAGVLQDYNEAVKWWRRAAEQGNSVAQFVLGVCCEKGKGVPQDFAQAYAWYNLAATQQEEAIKARDKVLGLMPASQIEEGQRFAGEYAEKYIKKVNAPKQTTPPGEQVKDVFGEAISLCKTGQVEQAILLSKIATEKTPRDSNVWLAYGTALVADGQFSDGSKAMFRAAEAIRNENPSMGGMSVQGLDKAFEARAWLFEGMADKIAKAPTPEIADHVRKGCLYLESCISDIKAAESHFNDALRLADAGGFSDATTVYKGILDSLPMRPEYKKAASSTRYHDNNDGTVTDTATGLMWTKNANHGQMPWANAVAYCDNLVTNGYSDWRLPSVAHDGGAAELDTLFRKDGKLSGAWEGYAGTPFTDVQDNLYWSGTSFANMTGNAWYIGMGGGSVEGFVKSFPCYVWPVRGE